MLGIFLQVLIGPVGLKIIYADADRKSALTIAAFAVVATPLGIWLLRQTTPDVARLLSPRLLSARFCWCCCRKNPASPRGPRKPPRPVSLLASSRASPPCPARPSCPIICASRSTRRSARVDDARVFRNRDCRDDIVLRAWSWKLAAGWLRIAFPADAAWQLAGREIFGKVPAPLWRTFVAVVLGLAGFSAMIRLLN